MFQASRKTAAGGHKTSSNTCPRVATRGVLVPQPQLCSAPEGWAVVSVRDDGGGGAGGEEHCSGPAHSPSTLQLARGSRQHQDTPLPFLHPGVTHSSPLERTLTSYCLCFVVWVLAALSAYGSSRARD